jgi:hypothetical protein
MVTALKTLSALALPLAAVVSISLSAEQPSQSIPKPMAYWNVDDVRAGMKGIGRTVMKGTKVEEFKAEVLGVLKNTSPGRDLVLCRLSGLNLDHTGVIAGMSGSPVYIDNKLLGAVAYAWAYGKEPIAGVTPFSQMHGFVEAFERRDLSEQGKPIRVGMKEPLRIGGKDYDAVTVAQGFDAAPAREDDGLLMVPLQTPLAATGFTPHALKLLRERVGSQGLLPVMTGGATGKIQDEEKDTALEPGGPLAVALITGDFDLSGIGTVTHIEGDRVYGWGHPFMSLGGCEFPLMTGYIHTIYPRQTVSFKMGSPLRTVGIINADVSTGIAGWLGRKPDMMPLKTSVVLGNQSEGRTFNVQLVRQKALLPTLVFTALTNSVDMEGELPEEMSAEMTARIELDGYDPLVLKDTFSGFSGGRAPAALYTQIAGVVNMLTTNPYKPVRITRIECATRILPGRRSADIEAVELDSDVYAPGETVKARVFVRPYKGDLRRVEVEMKLPTDLAEGNYTLTACDDTSNVRAMIRDDPALNNPQDVGQVIDSARAQLRVCRTNLVLRLPTGSTGVALGGKALKDLPPSMIHILGNTRRTGSQTVSSALVASKPTEWVVVGSESVRISVNRNHHVTKD